LAFSKPIVNSRSVASLLAAIALTTSSTLFARIGETEQECAARYGEPIKKFPDNSSAYQKSGLAIIITFFNGKADSIGYRKIATNALGKGEQLSENEVEILLNSNSGGVSWKQRAVISVNRNWETEDGEFLATYSTFENLLKVGTKDFRAREKAKKEAKESQNLEGF
jgi:spore coat protein CotH